MGRLQYRSEIGYPITIGSYGDLAKQIGTFGDWIAIGGITKELDYIGGVSTDRGKSSVYRDYVGAGIF